MKFGLPAKLAIVLMVASPFAYAEFECLPLAGTTLFMSASGTNGCPQRSFKLVNGTQCEVVLHEPQCTGVEGEWFGTYRYTGSVFNQNPTDPDPTDPNNPSNPVPDDLSEIRQPRQYVGEDAANFSNAQYYSENSLFAATSVIFRNQNSLYQNIADRLSNHDQDIKASLQNNVSAVNSLGANFSTSLDKFDASNKAFHEKTYEAQALAQQSLDTLPQLSFGIEALLSYAQVTYDSAYNANSNAREAFYAAQNAEHAAYDTYGLLSDTREDIIESRNTIRKNTTTLSSIDSATSQLWGMSDTINSETRGAVQNAASSTQDTIWSSNSQIMDYMGSFNSAQSDELSEIKSSIEALANSGGSGSDMTATNEKLDKINNTLESNNTNLSSQLGQQLDQIESAIKNNSGGGSGQGDAVAHEKLDGLGDKLDGIKGSLDGLSDTSGFSDDLAQGTAQGKSDLNQLLDGYDSDKMLSDRFKAITDEAEKTMKDSGLSRFSDPSKFIDDSGFVKPQDFDDLVSFAQHRGCSPYRITIHGDDYQVDLCRYANQSSSFLNYVFAVLTAIFCFVMISQTLINERLS